MSKFILIAGPCVVEGRDMILRHAEALKRITETLPVDFYLKASYSKDNREKADTFRGLGMERGLAILAEAKQQFDLKICTDVHEVSHVQPVAEVADVIQIPAFLCRQTDLLVTAGLTGKIVQVKKGQFMAPAQMKGAVEKIHSTGNRNVWLTERGATFGYGDLIFDPRSIAIMKSFCDIILHDATHSVQQPGGTATGSGGQRRYIEPLARAAIAVGVSGIFCETHENPSQAKSDSATQYPLDEFPAFLDRLLALHTAIQ